MEKEYICVCGRIFTNPQSFNAHKRHCIQHLQSVDKLCKMKEADNKAAATARDARTYYSKERKEKLLETWILEQHKCEKCGKVMTEKFGSGRFCSKACANSREQSKETKEKIKAVITKKAAIKSDINEIAYLQNPKLCVVCKNAIPYQLRENKTCGNENCIKMLRSYGGRKGGIASAEKIVKRSKNEIAFCKLCENYFGINNVKHNVTMFNGWDADIILVKEKIAILWNGPWHYVKLKKKHNLKQVKNRDALKIKEIQNCGFKPYVIKDLHSENKNKVLTEFNLLLEYLKLNS